MSIAIKRESPASDASSATLPLPEVNNIDRSLLFKRVAAIDLLRSFHPGPTPYSATIATCCNFGLFHDYRTIDPAQAWTRA